MARSGLPPSELENMTNMDYEITLKKAEQAEKRRSNHMTEASSAGSGFTLHANDPVAAAMHGALQDRAADHK